MNHQFTKTSAEFLDYTHNCSQLLEGDEVVSSSTWIVPTGLTLGTGQFAPSHSTTSCTAWLGGGTAGTTYRCANRVTTSAGRIHEHFLNLYITD
jgi:hypothetical protein